MLPAVNASQKRRELNIPPLAAVLLVKGPQKKPEYPSYVGRLNRCFFFFAVIFMEVKGRTRIDFGLLLSLNIDQVNKLTTSVNMCMFRGLGRWAPDSHELITSKKSLLARKRGIWVVSDLDNRRLISVSAYENQGQKESSWDRESSHRDSIISMGVV